jgi:hypothetical protein
MLGLILKIISRRGDKEYRNTPQLPEPHFMQGYSAYAHLVYSKIRHHTNASRQKNIFGRVRSASFSEGWCNWGVFIVIIIFSCTKMGVSRSSIKYLWLPQVSMVFNDSYVPWKDSCSLPWLNWTPCNPEF